MEVHFRLSKQPRCAFTLIELLIVIAIIALLAAILFSVFWGIRQKGQQTTCVSNLRQLTTALTMYVQDNDGVFLPGGNAGVFPPDSHDKPLEWPERLSPYIRNKSVFRCPTCIVPEVLVGGNGPWGYAANIALSHKNLAQDLKTVDDTPAETDAPFPSTTVGFCEVSFTMEKDGGIGIATMTSAPQTHVDNQDTNFIGTAGGLRHNAGSNYGFIDGHVKWYKPDDVLYSDDGNDGQHPSFGLKPLTTKP